jgi:DNA-binding Lrp family transcriptional regulator
MKENDIGKVKEQKLLFLLRSMLKNSRLSDRDMAKLLHISQPTVTRLRRSLETSGYVKSYTVVPDFAKMGYRVLAFTFSKLKSYPQPKDAQELFKRATEWAGKHPNVIYAADGQGLGGKDIVMISFHKDYDDYTKFIHSYAFEWGQIISIFETFITSTTSEFTMKPFDLKYLAYDEQNPRA